MAPRCGVKAAKVSLGTFNVFFWLVGGVLLALASWIFLDGTKERLLALSAPSHISDHLLFYLGYALLVLGCASLAAGVLGCCGALQGSRGLLIAYYALVLVLVLGQVAVAAAALVTRVQVTSGLQDRLLLGLRHKYGGQRSGDHSSYSDSVDLAQYKLECCGARGADDFRFSRWWNESRAAGGYTRSVPPTCCVQRRQEGSSSGSPLSVVSRAFGGTVEEPWQTPQPKDEAACQQENAGEDVRHKMGCAPALAAWFQREALVLIVAMVGAILFQLVGLGLAVCLCRALAADLEADAEEEPAEES